MALPHYKPHLDLLLLGYLRSLKVPFAANDPALDEVDGIIKHEVVLLLYGAAVGRPDLMVVHMCNQDNQVTIG